MGLAIILVLALMVPAQAFADDAPAASPADVLGAQGAPAECPLGEDAAAPAGDLLGEAPEDAETREEPAVEIPGSEDAADDPAAPNDGVGGSGDTQGGLPAGADLAPGTAATDEAGESDGESPEDPAAEPSEEEADAEQPLLLEADPKAASTGHWEVTSNRGHGLQRYWVVDGKPVKGRLVSPEEGSGWWAYARPEGYVVRGKYVAKDGKVYLANNDGRLENPGWVVTSKYDGSMQRYYVDSEAHAAVPGYSKDGWAHYTLPGKGYVARGSFVDNAGRQMTADNDGRVKGGIPKPRNGWVVSSAFGHGLQRYWFRDDVMSKSELLPASETGWWAYARPEGYVVRGKYVARDGKVYLANNDGRLENPGWVVTSKYGDGLQRYWIDSSAHAAVPGASADGWAHYTVPGKGYVLRGKLRMGSGMLLADNDGRLESRAGWLVTRDYDSGLQRYWLEDKGFYSAAKLGRFELGGSSYYGREDQGYVVRGAWISPARKLLFANNDGVLRTSISGDAKLDSYIERIIVGVTGVGSDALRKGFDYVAGYRFQNQNTYPGNSTDWSIAYAKEMFEKGIGNCYRYASLMRWIATGLGYDAYIYSGSEPYYDGRTVPHGWTTIKQNGKTYVIDCENEYERRLRGYNHNWFMVTYKEAPVQYRTEDGKRALEDFVV